MSLEESLEKNTAALARLADLIERNRGYLAGQMVGPIERTDAVTEAKLEAAVEKVGEHAIEQAAPPPAEVMADSMVFAPGEEIPEFTWEGVTKKFRKYAQKHGRDEAVKLAEEFGLTIPLNKDALTPDRYEDFYYACSN